MQSSPLYDGYTTILEFKEEGGDDGKPLALSDLAEG